jgi:DNA-binding IclR family transcriptional regulator
MADGPLERALELLTQISQEPGPITVADLAERAAMPVSTAYRLLAELRRHGMVAQDGRGSVSLGTRVVALGRAAEERLRERLVEPAESIMERLSREQGETVILTAPCGPEAIVLHVVETEQRVRLSYASFRRAPIHLGASGKVLAAFLDAPERERLLAAVGDPGLAAALDEIRELGWCLTTGEVDLGVSAVAAPILDRRRQIVAGLSLAGPSERMAAHGFGARAAAGHDAARSVEAALRLREADRPVRV